MKKILQKMNMIELRSQTCKTSLWWKYQSCTCLRVRVEVGRPGKGTGEVLRMITILYILRGVLVTQVYILSRPHD